MASRGSALGPRVRQRLCCCFEHSVKHIEEQRIQTYVYLIPLPMWPIQVQICM